MGGLAASVLLAARGISVTLLERSAFPGGKMRTVTIDNVSLDAGPTVFTMRWVFEELFASAGTSLAAHLDLQPLTTLARHVWSGSEQLDLFADAGRSADAIGRFAGRAEAQGYRSFCAEAARIYRTLEHHFIRAERPTPWSLVRQAGLGEMLRINPFETMAHALRRHFRDARLLQLFGRYATYCGASPYQAPATLMLVAHVEQQGVWLVQGGMHRIATCLAGLAESQGARLRYGAEVTEIVVRDGRAAGVVLESGERIEADGVVANADVAALAAGSFGAASAGSVPARARGKRSLSAVTWAVVARTEGVGLLRHNVFFSHDYVAEFDALFKQRRLARVPTIYVCAQDRGDGEDKPHGAERLLCLVNAPANGDGTEMDAEEIERCTRETFAYLARRGLTVRLQSEMIQVTTPRDFARLYPATGGALYGQAVHGAMASFRRPGAKTKLPGLYLAGGSTHPGAGLPMAALSGRLAAASVLMDYVLTTQ